jgi:hypothetical protein
MTKQRGSMTADEFMATFESDPQYIANQRKFDQELAERIAKRRVEQIPIVDDLRAAGVELEFLENLIPRATPYPEAIPVLLKHLALPYSDATLDTLARSLAVREARPAWPILVAQYLKAPLFDENGEEPRAKDGLACALSATATDAVMDQLIAIAKDPSNGGSRVLLLMAIKKSKLPAAKQALEEMATDPELAEEIALWRPRKKRAAPAK